MVSADMGRYSMRGVFDGCPIPTLVVEGQNDLTWGPEKAAVLKEDHPKAQFIQFEQAGHSLYQDVPELFFSALEGFLKNARPPSGRQSGGTRGSAPSRLTSGSNGR